MRPSRTILTPTVVIALLCGWALSHAESPSCQTKTFTLTSDFTTPDGYWINVNTTGADRLSVREEPEPLPYIWVALSGAQRGSIVRIDTDSGQVIGEYQSAPEGRGRNPSRTSVNMFGDVFAGNRDETPGLGSVVKIGLVIGGTRVNADGSVNPNGLYLKPPFDYCTCVDRDGDGLIKTSRALQNVLSWPDCGDGEGGWQCGDEGGPALVEDADDECILVFQRTHGYAVKHVSVQGDSNVWVGGVPDAHVHVDGGFHGHGRLLDQCQHDWHGRVTPQVARVFEPQDGKPPSSRPDGLPPPWPAGPRLLPSLTVFPAV
jgi:hypothetical protein